MKKKTPYDYLPIVPTIIADTVVGEVYTGSEVSDHSRCGRTVTAVEAVRSGLSMDERREFADLCEKRCRAAYEADAEWMLKIGRSKTDRGRDQLYVWIRHWLSAYCLHRDIFKRDCGITGDFVPKLAV